MHPNVICYEITGMLYRSRKRFKIETRNRAYALGINLWRGTVWEVYFDKYLNRKRRILRRVYN